MTKRPREHVLETESRNAFRGVVPAEWVVRDIHEDYGVDLEVEIFVNGVTSGVTFRVQLRATDSLLEPPKVRVERDEVQYWRASDSPVLLVRYVASTRSIWGMWAIDGRIVISEARTLTVKFESADRMVKGGIDFIERDLAARRLRRAGTIKTVEVGVTFDGLDLDTESSLMLSLIQSSSPMGGRVKFSRNPSNPVAQIRISENLAKIWLLIGPSFSFPLSFPDLLGPDCVVGLALCFSNEGSMSSVAAGLLASAICLSEFREIEVLVEPISGCLIPAGHLETIRRLAAESSGQVQLLYQMALLEAQASGYTGAELRLSERARAKALESAGNAEEAAVIWYTTGKQALHAGEVDDALVDLENARRVDSAYGERSYWWKDCGGAYFLAGRVSEASKSYLRAFELGKPEVEQLLGDALMHLGRYEEALDRLAVPWSGNWQAGANWQVLAIVARYFVDELEVSSQERDVPAANLALETGDFVAALQADLMCSSAWILKGVADGFSGIDPFISALCATATEPGETLPALLATLMLTFQDDQTVELVFRHVARHGEELGEMLRNTDPELSERFLNWLASNQPPTQDLTIRYVSYGEPEPELVLRRGS